MTEQIFYCPHCGRPLGVPGGVQPIPPTDQPEEPGVIRDFDAGEGSDAAFNIRSLIQITDLTGDPFHDWPLIMARFQNTLPWLVEVILSDPATARYVKGYKSETQAEPYTAEEQRMGDKARLWLDLDMVRPHLPKIIRQGQFTYGHQSRIAEALGVPNQGSYRTRIQNVVSALQRTLIRPKTSTTTDSTAAAQEKPGKTARAA